VQQLETRRQVLACSVECCTTGIKWQSSEMLSIAREFALSGPVRWRYQDHSCWRWGWKFQRILLSSVI